MDKVYVLTESWYDNTNSVSGGNIIGIYKTKEAAEKEITEQKRKDPESIRELEVEFYIEEMNLKG